MTPNCPLPPARQLENNGILGLFLDDVLVLLLNDILDDVLLLNGNASSDGLPYDDAAGFNQGPGAVLHVHHQLSVVGADCNHHDAGRCHPHRQPGVPGGAAERGRRQGMVWYGVQRA